VVTLKLPMPVRIEDWFQNQSVAVTRGPLVYSLKIAEKRVERTSDAEEIKPLLHDHDIKGFPAVEFYPESEWRYGFDAVHKTDPSHINVIETDMTENPFMPDQTPVRLELPLSPLPDWAPRTTPNEPSGLPTAGQHQAVGQSVNMVLVPHGSTHLRLTTLPLISFTNAAAVR
jgi:hypothetical protein